MGRAGRLLDGLLTSLLPWCSSPCSSCLLIVSTETPKSRAGSLTWGPHSEDAIQRLERRPRPPARRKPTSTRPVSERPSLLGKPHAGLRAESSRSLSSFCSIPPEDWPESGRDQGPQPTFRTGSERFARFWSSLSTVRDREAPGSDPGPPTNPLRARRAKRLNFGRVRIVQQLLVA